MSGRYFPGCKGRAGIRKMIDESTCYINSNLGAIGRHTQGSGDIFTFCIIDSEEARPPTRPGPRDGGGRTVVVGPGTQPSTTCWLRALVALHLAVQEPG